MSIQYVSLKAELNVKLSPCLTKYDAVKTYWENGGTAPRILHLGFTPRPLYSHGKNHWYPLDRRLSGPQNRFGRGVEEKNIPSLHLPGIEPWSSNL
jgi:hypothetical protein